MGAVYRIFHLNAIPWIGLELFYTKRHFAFVAVEGEDHCIHFFAHSHEVLCAVKVLCPAHFRYVNQSFHTRSNLYECTVVGNDNHFTLYDVAHFQCFTQGIPWMGCQLFQTESDAFFLVVEIEDYHVDLVVELYHFFGVLNASPGKVCNVYQSVYATQVDKRTVGSDVFNHTFEYLSFFEFRDNFFLLLFQFFLNECFV